LDFLFSPILGAHPILLSPLFALFLRGGANPFFLLGLFIRTLLALFAMSVLSLTLGNYRPILFCSPLVGGQFFFRPFFPLRSSFSTSESTRLHLSPLRSSLRFPSSHSLSLSCRTLVSPRLRHILGRFTSLPRRERIDLSLFITAPEPSFPFLWVAEAVFLNRGDAPRSRNRSIFGPWDS